MVECGSAHTLIKSVNNDVFAFGLNDNAQLGIGLLGGSSFIPHKLKRFTSFQIAQLRCSDESSAALTTNGDLYVWGKNACGMFNTDNHRKLEIDSHLTKPQLLQGIKAQKVVLSTKLMIYQKALTGSIMFSGSLADWGPPPLMGKRSESE